MCCLRPNLCGEPLRELCVMPLIAILGQIKQVFGTSDVALHDPLAQMELIDANQTSKPEPAPSLSKSSLLSQEMNPPAGDISRPLRPSARHAYPMHTPCQQLHPSTIMQFILSRTPFRTQFCTASSTSSLHGAVQFSISTRRAELPTSRAPTSTTRIQDAPFASSATAANMMRCQTHKRTGRNVSETACTTSPTTCG